MEKKVYEQTYTCTITSDNGEREYDVTTRSAIKAAYKYGRCAGGEVVTIRRKKSGKVISQARWTPENGGYYCEVVRE